MKPKFSKVLEIAIEQGVQYGYNRAFKYVENPSENTIVESIVAQVINSIDDWFEYTEDHQDS